MQQLSLDVKSDSVKKNKYKNIYYGIKINDDEHKFKRIKSFDNNKLDESQKKRNDLKKDNKKHKDDQMLATFQSK